MRLHVGLLVLLGALAAAAQEPPAALRLGARQRLIYHPPLVAESGAYRLTLVELDRLEVAGEPFGRFLVRATVLTRETLPDDLVLLGEPFAVSGEGATLATAELSRGLRVGDGWWLAFTFPMPPGARLPVLAGTLAPRPREDQRRFALRLQPLGEVHLSDDLPFAAQVSVLRRETTPLPVDALPAPLEAVLEDTRPTGAERPAASETEPYLTLRLYTLGPEPGESDWRLADLRLIGAGGEVQRWRYVRRLWRPDWGGWLGATGRDSDANGQPAILVEEVTPSSPAERAGLQVGDKLLRLDGAPVGPAFAFGELIRRRAPDSAARLTVERDGKPLELALLLGRRQLWPDRDPAELEQAWNQLGAAVGPGAEHVLAQWDWQSWEPLPAGFKPERLELMLARTAPARGTSFVFRDVPLAP